MNKNDNDYKITTDELKTISHILWESAENGYSDKEKIENAKNRLIELIERIKQESYENGFKNNLPDGFAPVTFSAKLKKRERPWSW